MFAESMTPARLRHRIRRDRSVVSSPPMEPGQRIAHYEIEGALGRGGKRVLYPPRDTKLDRVVAMMFLPPEICRDARAKERFVREAQSASALDHPNMCTIHDIAETDDGRLYIVMAYYRGRTLKERLEDDVIRYLFHLDPAGVEEQQRQL